MMQLEDFIMVSEPVLAPINVVLILEALEKVQWRVPDTSGYLRTCTTYPISAAIGGNYPVPSGMLGQIKWADDILLVAALEAIRVYKEKFQVNTKTDSGFDILRYEKGQYIDCHIDDLEPRTVAMSIALNDDYTGGEFRFWREKVIKVPIGCAIMFPPNFMYPHEILRVETGTRYSMITWFK